MDASGGSGPPPQDGDLKHEHVEGGLAPPTVGEVVGIAETDVPGTLERPLVGEKVGSLLEGTRERVALGLLGLAGGILVVTGILIGVRAITAAEAKDLLGVAFVPVVTLLGAATGFYFGGRSGRW